MAAPRGTVLVDTNAIIECWRVGAWRALVGSYRVETVEACVTETQTGFQRRRPEQHIDGAELQRSLAAIHQVDDRARAEVLLRAGDIHLDQGERDLWAHALARDDAWVLSGPDKASLRFGVRAGMRDRLAALEALLAAVGHRPKIMLKTPYTARWHAQTVSEFVVAERGRP